eukprot:COSAG01_NODE_6033_length_3888_cov_22.141990_1_plen_268_part_00
MHRLDVRYKGRRPPLVLEFTVNSNTIVNSNTSGGRRPPISCALKLHMRAHGAVGQTEDAVNSAIAAAMAADTPDDEVIARLCTARDAHRSAVRIAAAAGGDKDTAARASFGDPRAMTQLKRAKDTPAQFTSQRTVQMTNKDVMSGDAVSDPVLRSMLLDPANWTQGTPLSRWDTPSDEEFVSNINDMKVNNYNYWSHMFRDYPICVAAQNYMFKRLPSQFAWPSGSSGHTPAVRRFADSAAAAGCATSPRQQAAAPTLVHGVSQTAT